MVDIPENESITRNWYPSIVEIVPGVILLSTADGSDRTTSPMPAAYLPRRALSDRQSPLCRIDIPRQISHPF
jgi:hypothetical protein